MKDLICEDLHIVLQVPPVMYTIVVLGASGCRQICKFDARSENHHIHTHAHIRLLSNAAEELADASTWGKLMRHKLNYTDSTDMFIYLHI